MHYLHSDTKFVHAVTIKENKKKNIYKKQQIWLPICKMEE